MCVLKNTHDHKNTMGRPGKKTTHTENEDEPPWTDEEQGLNQTKQGPPNPSASNQNTNEAEEQRHKELHSQL